MLQSGRSWVQVLKRLNFFSLLNPSCSTIALGFTQVSIRNEYQKQKSNVSGGKVWPVGKADNLTTMCEPVV
jgi:hypothetical protein